jgi:hypothetical protein
VSRRAIVSNLTSSLMIAVLLLCSLGFGKEEKPRRGTSEKQRIEFVMPPEVSETSKLSFVLGCPTDKSVIISILSAENIEGFIEYGNSSGNYTNKTEKISISAGKPAEIVLDNLKANTEYFYRLMCRKQGEDSLVSQPEYGFHTCRAKDSDFCFVVQVDSHLDEQSSSELYKRTLLNELSDKPDFLVDLGDTFMTDKLTEKSNAAIQNRYLLQRSFFSLITHSVPLYLVSGNHDGQTGWILNGPESSLASWSSQFQKTYFPNPEPDNFYSGNTDVEKFAGRPENYFAWSWGDALFVVLDPYWYTSRKPGRNVDNWGWTLGDKQYKWFKETLEKSNAKFKFVFCHQLIGGGDEGRGGVEFAKYFEMGGLNKDKTWGFDEKRPAWEKPIHQLMVDNNVTIFFHGHDHFFVKQELDGVIYQLVPQPSHPNFKNAQQAESYGYITGDILPNSGHLRVNVSDSKVMIDYIRAFLRENETERHRNGEIAYTYTIKK